MISFAKRERARRAAAVVGVDAGKFTHTLVVRPGGRPDSKPHTFPTTRAGFDRALAYISLAAAGAAPTTILIGIEFAGNYGFTFAHYLAQRGFPVVSVLPAHTKRWKDVAQGQPLKTDAKDAATITDLLAQGHFVAFPFLEPAYADLRYLAAGRERLALLRRARSRSSAPCSKLCSPSSRPSSPSSPRRPRWRSCGPTRALTTCCTRPAGR